MVARQYPLYNRFSRWSAYGRRASAAHLSRTTMKRAFTLIELLVVIAIIAILAAILFPVFAQAKQAAKKTAALSNIKQNATATAIYTTDTDDTFPLGLEVNSTRPQPAFYTGGNALYPAGWHTNGRIEAEDIPFWANSTEAYRKNLDLLSMGTGAQRVRITAWANEYSKPLKQWGNANFTYNGYLHALSSSSVVSPSTNPLYWQGIGDLEQVGLARTNPRLVCNSTAAEDCRFNPTSAPQGGASQATNIAGFGAVNYHPFGNSALYVATDTSARSINVGTGNRTGANTVVPWYELNAAGQFPGTSYSWWGCRLDSATAYSYVMAFRPDNDYSADFGNKRCN